MGKKRGKPEFAALRDPTASDRAVIWDQEKFLQTVWSPGAFDPPGRYGALCFRRRNRDRMLQKFLAIGDWQTCRTIIREYDRHHWDQFFSPNLYRCQSRKLEHVARSWLGWCDVDNADPYAFKPTPSVVWQTSPGRTQAIWFWDRIYSAAKASAYSKALTYRHGGDKGGSAANKLLRVPGSFNHKPEYDLPFVGLLDFNPKRLSERPRLLQTRPRSRSPVLRGDLDPSRHKRLGVLKTYQSKLDISTRHLIRHDRVEAPDRSRRVFAMVAGLHEAGASYDEIASVIWSSPYFRDKYGADLDALEREVSSIISKVGDRT